MTDFYYKGFIDTCTGHGMDKSAADLLYKRAAKGQFVMKGLEWLGKGLGQLFRGGRWVTGGLASAAGKGARGARTLGSAVANATSAAGKAIGSGASAASTAIGKGFRQVVPTSKLPALNISGRLGGLAHPFQATANFVAKHPKMGILGAAAGGAYLTNMANQASMADAERAKMPTLTPSQQAMYDRYASGMNLPGLGLDPSTFTGYGSYL